MDRLTERDEYKNADIIGVNSVDIQCNLSYEDFCRVTDALNRLAAYEDSGLTPEQVAALVEELAQAKRERDTAVRDLRDNAQRSCYVCKHWENGRCISPNKNECAGFNWWHWRGPCAENGGTK